MKKNGFIASSLLYGMLALFLVLMISTLYIFGNNKVSMDKLKDNALEKVGNASNNLMLSDYITASIQRTGENSGDFIITVNPSTDVELTIDWYKTTTTEASGTKISTGKVLAGNDTSDALTCSSVQGSSVKLFAILRDTTGAYKGEISTPLIDASTC